MHNKKTLFIVGNAAVTTDMSEQVDAADFVIRFNECNNRGKGTGRKTDIICINYSMMLKILSEDRLASNFWVVEPFDSTFMFEVKRVLIHIYIQMNVMYFRGLRRRAFYVAFKRRYPRTLLFRERLFKRVRRKVKTNIFDFRQPSTGLLAVEFCLDQRLDDRYDIKCIGFTWEGLLCHNWEREEQIMKGYHEQKRLTIIP